MNWIARWIGLGVLLTAPVGFAKQSLEVYVGRMEASMRFRAEYPYSNKLIANYVPVYDGYYDGGVAYNLTGEYFKVQASFGMGVYHDDPTYSGTFTMGPKYSVLPHLLDLHVGGGLGYFGYWEDNRGTDREDFNYRTPIILEAEGVVFDRVSLGYSRFIKAWDGTGNARLEWKLKLGVKVVEF